MRVRRVAAVGSAMSHILGRWVGGALRVNDRGGPVSSDGRVDSETARQRDRGSGGETQRDTGTDAGAGAGTVRGGGRGKGDWVADGLTSREMGQ